MASVSRGGSLLAAEFAKVAVADESLILLVPKSVAESFQAAAKGDGFDAVEKRMSFVAAFEVIVRNARAEMVNVMEADVTGKPLEDFREFVERTALQCGCGVVPLVATLPIGVFKLMLHVKEPDTCGTGDGHHGELNEDVLFKTENPTERSDQSENSEVHPIAGTAIALAGFGGGEAVHHDE